MRIILAYHGTGKTHLAQSRGGFIDLEAYCFMPIDEKYYQAIEQYPIYGYTVLGLCRDYIIKELLKRGLNFTVVIPKISDKKYFLDRFKNNRIEEDDFYEDLLKQYEANLKVIEKVAKGKIVYLEKGQYLSDIIDDL